MKNRIALCIEKNGPLGSDIEVLVTCRAYTSESQRNEATLEIMEAFNQSISNEPGRSHFCKITFGHNDHQGDFIPDTPGDPAAHYVDGKWAVARIGLPRTLRTRFEISEIPPFGTVATTFDEDKGNPRFFETLSEAVNCLVKSSSSTNPHKTSIVDRFTGARFWIESSDNHLQLVADSAFAKEVLRDALNSQRADYLIGQAANVISQMQDSNDSDETHSLIVELLEYLGDGSHSPHQHYSIPSGG